VFRVARLTLLHSTPGVVRSDRGQTSRFRDADVGVVEALVFGGIHRIQSHDADSTVSLGEDDRMLRTLLCTALLAVVAAAVLPAQIADFTVHGNSFGTYNMSVAPVPATPFRPRLWGRTIENAEWVISVWLDADVNFGVNSTDVTARYEWSTMNKLTGVTTAPTPISPGPGLNNFILTLPAGGLGLEDMHELAPSITWTYGGSIANGRDGFAVALLHSNPLLSSDVYVYFFELDSTVTPAAWVPAPLRNPVNVSETNFGNAKSPSVVGMKSGDMVVVWQDNNPAGTTGAVPGINPQGPPQNPNLLVSDVFARRFQQEFPLVAAGPGMVDGAVQFGQGSTVNVSGRSFTFEIWPQAVSDNGEGQVYVLFLAAGSEADDVAGLGPNSGPKGGVVQGELWDTYMRRIAVPAGQTGLTPATALNVSTSGGSGWRPGDIAYNDALNQVGILFMDGSTHGNGVGGNPNLNPVFNTNQTTGAPLAASDVFFAVMDRLTIQPFAMINASVDPNIDNSCALTGMGINGWCVGYSTVDGAAAINTRIEVYALQNGNLASQSIKRLYPTQAITNPTQVNCSVFGVHSYGGNTLGITFMHDGGNPDNLRPGQPASLLNPANGNAPVLDSFLAYGESTTVPPTAGQLSVSRVTINGDNPIDKAGGGIIPSFIEVEIVLQNINGLNPMSISALTLIPPPGFTVTGTPTLPVILAAGATQTFIMNVATNAALMVPGQNQFDVAATGIIQSAPTVATGKGIIAVTGTQGSLAGVSISAIMNPSVITTGTINKINLTITIANAGQFPLVDLKLLGTFIQGFTPVDANKIKFVPEPGNILVPSGGITSFTGEVTVGAGVSPRTYQPAFTLNMRQQANIGSVTVMLANQMTLLPNPNASLGAGQVGLVNSSQGNFGRVEGCSLTQGGSGSLPWVIVTLAGLAMAAIAVRRLRA